MLSRPQLQPAVPLTGGGGVREVVFKGGGDGLVIGNPAAVNIGSKERKKKRERLKKKDILKIKKISHDFGNFLLL